MWGDNATKLNALNCARRIDNHGIAGQSTKPSMVLVVVRNCDNIGLKSDGFVSDFATQRTGTIGVNQYSRAGIRYTRKTRVTKVLKLDLRPLRSCNQYS